MSEQDPNTPPPSEEELRAAYEAQLKQLRVDDLLIETLISLLNLGGRKAGLAPGSEDERDLPQVRTAIEGVRALMPLCEAQLGPDAGQIRTALSQLQMAYAQLVGEGATPAASPAPAAADVPETAPPEPAAPKPGEAGPAQSSGRLWVPGQ
jgi:hypothetical protein